MWERCIWWRLEAPARRNTDLAAVLEAADATPWHDQARTERLLSLMSPLHRRRLDALCAARGQAVGTVYRRTRLREGRRVQRAEIRFDGLAGCLRTPRGGSSRQTVIVVEDGTVRTRLLTPREGARLMGLPETYRPPAGATAAFHVMGDGVAVPVVRWLAQALLEPLLGASGEVLAAE